MHTYKQEQEKIEIEIEIYINALTNTGHEATQTCTTLVAALIHNLNLLSNALKIESKHGLKGPSSAFTLKESVRNLTVTN